MGIPTEIAPIIATEIARIKSGVSAAYTAVKNKGVTTSKTKIADLAGEISKIQTGKTEEEKTVDLNMASGNQVITPTDGKAMSKVTVKKPRQLAPAYIRKGYTIGGVTGTLPAYSLVEKEVVITENGTTVYTPDPGSSLNDPKAYGKFTVTVNVGGSSGGGYTITFDDGIYAIYGASIFTISVTTSDGDTTTLDDAAGKTYTNVTEVSFSDNDEYETYILSYKMPPSAESSQAQTPCTITLTDDAEFISLWK